MQVFDLIGGVITSLLTLHHQLQLITFLSVSLTQPKG